MIDLHTHSVISDGSDEPEAICEMAVSAGCSAFALTDHDRLDGIERARARATQLGITMVPGCEVSCEWSPGTCHVLVYFVEPGDSPLARELERLQDDREHRNQRLVSRLVDVGVPITLDEVETEAGGGSIGRPHFAAVMVSKGVVGSPQEAFDRYLAKGKPAYISKARVLPGQVAALARDSGGVAVLAHPWSLGLDYHGTEGAIAELAAAGFSGVEAYYGRYSPEDRRALVEMASRHGLVATGGSDHHGSYKPDLHVGVGTGDLEVPDSVIGELEDHRP
ncbi:MAG TPA: PHP domain-containing protein [Acidimicrobiales bacterium]|nr:PHP domain-containing protein [Acidimicrobiales bacterium]